MIYLCPFCGVELIGNPVNSEIVDKVYWCWWCNQIIDIDVIHKLEPKREVKK